MASLTNSKDESHMIEQVPKSVWDSSSQSAVSTRKQEEEYLSESEFQN